MSKLRIPDVRRTFHVVYDDSLQQWKVAYEGAELAYSAHSTKEEAVQGGRELAHKQQPSRLVIHRVDGSVQTEHTYGDAPAPANEAGYT